MTRQTRATKWIMSITFRFKKVGEEDAANKESATCQLGNVRGLEPEQIENIKVDGIRVYQSDVAMTRHRERQSFFSLAAIVQGKEKLLVRTSIDSDDGRQNQIQNGLTLRRQERRHV